ncbi:MAG: trypsin-like serine protease [Deltaproteobacteria bacterium]|jgi:hypothetical protein|nr:trypsin-like serine protease [Deltaproteobacteria bacterium]MBW2537069.1 trypsin-like serine protease [Deltaproteobacteria bacterium]
MKLQTTLDLVAAGLALAACSPDGLESGSAHIYGGSRVEPGDAIARSTVALLTSSDYDTGHALVDGSATLVGQDVAVGAAHTCLEFRPQYVAFGVQPPGAGFYDSYGDRERYPNVRAIERCLAHEEYDDAAAANDDQASHPVHDIALFFFRDTPASFDPAAVLAPNSELPYEITIAGFGAFEDQFDDLHTTGMKPYDLRAVDTFVSEQYAASLQFQDGPNPGRGSCQGDSGGSVYRRRGSRAERPVLVGIPVSGPACDEGIGYNTDIRGHVAWIEQHGGVSLDLVP